MCIDYDYCLSHESYIHQCWNSCHLDGLRPGLQQMLYAHHRQTAGSLHVSGIRDVVTCAPERCSCLSASACDYVEDAWWQLDLMHDGGHFKAGQTAHL